MAIGIRKVIGGSSNKSSAILISGGYFNKKFTLSDYPNINNFARLGPQYLKVPNVAKTYYCNANTFQLQVPRSSAPGTRGIYASCPINVKGATGILYMGSDSSGAYGYGRIIVIDKNITPSDTSVGAYYESTLQNCRINFSASDNIPDEVRIGFYIYDDDAGTTQGMTVGHVSCLIILYGEPQEMIPTDLGAI